MHYKNMVHEDWAKKESCKPEIPPSPSPPNHFSNGSSLRTRIPRQALCQNFGDLNSTAVKSFNKAALFHYLRKKNIENHRLISLLSGEVVLGKTVLR